MKTLRTMFLLAVILGLPLLSNARELEMNAEDSKSLNFGIFYLAPGILLGKFDPYSGRQLHYSRLENVHCDNQNRLCLGTNAPLPDVLIGYEQHVSDNPFFRPNRETSEYFRSILDKYIGPEIGNGAFSVQVLDCRELAGPNFASGTTHKCVIVL